MTQIFHVTHTERAEKQIEPVSEGQTCVFLHLCFQILHRCTKSCINIGHKRQYDFMFNCVWDNVCETALQGQKWMLGALELDRKVVVEGG